MWLNLTVSFRMLRRSPVFTAAAVLSLGLGIGANTAIFSLLYQVVLRSLPVDDPERLVLLHTDYSAPGSSSSDSRESVFSEPMYRDLRDRNAAFAGVIARSGAGVTLAYQAATESATAESVSGNFFRVLGVGAAAGRVLAPEDDGAPGANPVVVLSHAFWTTRFAGNPEIVNRTILLNRHPFVVIGVVDKRFQGLVRGSPPDVYVPISMMRAVRPTFGALGDRQVRWLNVFARLRPGFTIESAQVTTDVLYRSILEGELARMGPMRDDRARDEFLNHRALLRPAAQGVNGLGRKWGRPLELLMAMVGLVLAIACANVAGLLIARAAGRRREIAIRLAMGAGRAALIGQLLVESLLLALAGGVAGLLVASWMADALIRMLPRGSGSAGLSANLDPKLLLFNMALAVGCGILFGLAPAIQATHLELLTSLKTQLGGAIPASGPARLRRLLVVAQIALSLLLAAGAGLFAASLMRLGNLDLGFRGERLLSFSVNAALRRPALPEALEFYHGLLHQFAAIGGVADVGAADGGPFSGSNRGSNLTIEGYQALPDESVGSSTVAVSPGFFRALGIGLRAGREFDERDTANAPKAVVINEAFARHYFAGRNPLGMKLMFGESNRRSPDREIVGVVADFRTAVREPAREALYYPYTQWDRPARLTFYVRAAGDPDSLPPEIRRLVRAADPDIPTGDMKPVALRIRESIYADRLTALLSIAFGVLATLLAALGLYGVVAYAVERRTAEIGIRMALGATSVQVLCMVLRDAVQMASLGIGAGLVCALALGRMVESQLYGVDARDPTILGCTAALLLLIVVAASLVPGWHALRINPVTALKQE